MAQPAGGVVAPCRPRRGGESRRQPIPPYDQHPLIGLLRAAVDGAASAPQVGFDASAVDWAIDTGLGPVLRDLQRQRPGAVPAECVERLKAADLTARMLSAELFEGLDAILRAAAEAACEVTLLKGVSVAGQWYPRPHWRPMRDIDLLVEAVEQPRFERLLRELGFRQQGRLPATFFVDHQHSMPFFHPGRHCWVEVHRTLFREDQPAGRIAAFQPGALAAGRRRAVLGGGAVWRLDDPVQLVYTAVHWGSRLTLVGGLVPLLDILFMLRRGGTGWDWDAVLHICANETAARHVFVALNYLHRRELIEPPAEVWRGLARGRASIGAGGVRILHRIIDEFMVRGALHRGFDSEALVNMRWETLLGEGPAWRKRLQLPWRTLFPPAPAGRYSPRRHLRRLRGLLR